MTWDTLYRLKDFLEDRPSWAFLALSLGVNSVLFALYVRSMNARLEELRRWAPLADQLSRMFSDAAQKARRRKAPSDKEETP